MNADALIAELRTQKNARNIEGQRRFGITPNTEQLGISMPALRAIARRHRRDHALALALWDTAVHEGRILAVLIDDPKAVTRRQAERWARDLDSWDVCDQFCGEIMPYTAFAMEKALEWTERRSEFMKRAGFVTIARMAVRRKDLADELFTECLPILRREANDERNFVRKAVNWALRQIGKRSPRLRRTAMAEALEIEKRGTRSARWIARDALRELRQRS